MLSVKVPEIWLPYLASKNVDGGVVRAYEKANIYQLSGERDIGRVFHSLEAREKKLLEEIFSIGNVYIWSSLLEITKNSVYFQLIYIFISFSWLISLKNLGWYFFVFSDYSFPSFPST